MRDTDFAAVSAFLEVAKRHSFARAAQALGISNSRLSETVRALEESLGVRLLNRNSRSVTLTEAGSFLVGRISPAVEHLHHSVTSLETFREITRGRLRLRMSTVSSNIILVPILQKFLRQNPDIALEVIVTEQPHEDDGEACDGIIQYGWRLDLQSDAMRVSPRSRNLALASPVYLQGRERPLVPQDLQKHRCIRLRPGKGEPLAWTFERDTERIDVTLNGPLIVNNMAVLVEAVLAGVGIGLATEEYVKPLIQRGRLVPLIEDWSPFYSSYYLYHSSGSISAPMKAFVEFLRREPYSLR